MRSHHARNARDDALLPAPLQKLSTKKIRVQPETVANLSKREEWIILVFSKDPEVGFPV
jgi:hypothetical protein